MDALQQDLRRLVPLVEDLGAARAAADPHRQHFHIQPPVGWLNDPNGLCKAGDTYHVFYQYGPFDPNGGVKCWGHVTSTDLLHWRQEPVMLYPDQPYDCHGVYSGSALWEDGTLWLFFTGNVKREGRYDYVTAGRENNLCLATSRDGRTAETNECLLYNAGYPAGLSCHVRDPKVWAQDGRYYMALGARTLGDRGEVLIFESADKRHWRAINTLTTDAPFGYMWECPDLFALDGQWYLLVSPQGIECQNRYGCGYFPLYGDFRGKYTLGAFHPLDGGFDYYAPQSFLDGDRRLQFGWMGMPDAPYTNPTTACGWQHCLTVPRVLTRGADGRLRSLLCAGSRAAAELPADHRGRRGPCLRRNGPDGAPLLHGPGPFGRAHGAPPCAGRPLPQRAGPGRRLQPGNFPERRRGGPDHPLLPRARPRRPLHAGRARHRLAAVALMRGPSGPAKRRAGLCGPAVLPASAGDDLLPRAVFCILARKNRAATSCRGTAFFLGFGADRVPEK